MSKFVLNVAIAIPLYYIVFFTGASRGTGSDAGNASRLRLFLNLIAVVVCWYVAGWFANLLVLHYGVNPLAAAAIAACAGAALGLVFTQIRDRIPAWP